MGRGYYKSRDASNRRADMIGRVRLQTARNMRAGQSRSQAMKNAWKKVKSRNYYR